jgi:hypothetical protein
MLNYVPSFSKNNPRAISFNPYNSIFGENAIKPNLQEEKVKLKCEELRYQVHMVGQCQSLDLNRGIWVPGIQSYPLLLFPSSSYLPI